MLFWDSTARKPTLPSEVSSVGENKQGEELDGLAALDYHERLTHFLRGSTRHAINGNITVLDFRPLFALVIYHYQRELAKEVSDGLVGTVTEAQLDRIQRLTERYANTLRDFEFIHANRWHTSFVKDIAASRIDNGPSSRLHGAILDELKLGLSKGQDVSPVYTDEDLLGRFDATLLQHSSYLGQTRGTARQRNEAAATKRQAVRMAWRRFLCAICGGVVIVAPMALLAAPDTSIRQLIITVAFILGFAVGVALLSTAEPEHLVAATAAYAAVLVVFVGNPRS